MTLNFVSIASKSLSTMPCSDRARDLALFGLRRGLLVARLPLAGADRLVPVCPSAAWPGPGDVSRRPHSFMRAVATSRWRDRPNRSARLPSGSRPSRHRRAISAHVASLRDMRLQIV